MSNKTLMTGLEMVRVNVLNNVVVSWRLTEENGEIGLYVKNSGVLDCPYLQQASTPEEREERYQETVDAFLKTPNWLEVATEYGLTDTILWPVGVEKHTSDYTLVMSCKSLTMTAQPEKRSAMSWLMPMVTVASIVGAAVAICYVTQKK